jgi:hypothetical protein
MTDADITGMVVSDGEEVAPGSNVTSLSARLRVRKETVLGKPQRKRVEGRFVIVGLSGLIAAAATVDDRPLLVWLFLIHQARLRNVRSVKVTNRALAEWGVDRFTKYRMLEKLEVAGLIEVEQSPGSNPTVTLKHEF